MPHKDIKKITIAKSRGMSGMYTIIDMDGMADLNLNGTVVKVDDEITHEQAGWLADQWVTDQVDEDRNATKYTLKVKRG